MEERMRQSFNKVETEGWLNKKEFEIKTDENGKKYITGTVEIRTEETEIIPIEMFSYELTQKGKESKVYKGMLTVSETYKDATMCDSWQDADKVRVNGEIRINDFIGRDNELYSSVKYSTNFINRVLNSNDFNPKSNFSCEVVYVGENSEVKDGEETGRGILNGFLVDYSGNLKPINFILDEKLWRKVEGEFTKGETIYLTGDITNKVEVNKVKTDMDFGEDEERIITKTIRERKVKGIKRIEEKEYTKEEIKKGVELRTKYIEELKNKKKFGVDNKNNKKDESGFDFSEDDLPF